MPIRHTKITISMHPSTKCGQLDLGGQQGEGKYVLGHFKLYSQIVKPRMGYQAADGYKCGGSFGGTCIQLDLQSDNQVQ